jgi:hypothetical protein
VVVIIQTKSGNLYKFGAASLSQPVSNLCFNNLPSYFESNRDFFQENKAKWEFLCFCSLFIFAESKKYTLIIGDFLFKTKIFHIINWIMFLSFYTNFFTGNSIPDLLIKGVILFLKYIKKKYDGTFVTFCFSSISFATTSLTQIENNSISLNIENFFKWYNNLDKTRPITLGGCIQTGIALITLGSTTPWLLEPYKNLSIVNKILKAIAGSTSTFYFSSTVGTNINIMANLFRSEKEETFSFLFGWKVRTTNFLDISALGNDPINSSLIFLLAGVGTIYTVSQLSAVTIKPELLPIRKFLGSTFVQNSLIIGTTFGVVAGTGMISEPKTRGKLPVIPPRIEFPNPEFPIPASPGRKIVTGLKAVVKGMETLIDRTISNRGFKLIMVYKLVSPLHAYVSPAAFTVGTVVVVSFNSFITFWQRL